MTSHRQALQALAEALPDGAPVTMPVEWLRALLEGTVDASGQADTPPADFTVLELAIRFHKAPSTVRSWIVAGRLRSYLFGRERRVTHAALAEFEEAARAGGGSADQPRPGQRRKPISLSSWRAVS